MRLALAIKKLFFICRRGKINTDNCLLLPYAQLEIRILAYFLGLLLEFIKEMYIRHPHRCFSRSFQGFTYSRNLP